MTETSDRWTVPSYLQLRWHCWADEQFAVFNTLSGETHCLNWTAALFLQLLEERPATPEALVAEIRKALPDDAEIVALSQMVESLIEEFDKVGLIAPVRL
jgi:PqqD family protein of HPr-rel-A system